MSLGWWWPFGRVDEIRPDTLYNRLKAGDAQVQLIDVRTGLEFGESHIRGTRNIPIQSLNKALPKLGLDTSRPVVAICLSGHRSVPAYRLFKRAGFNEVYSLEGGMLAWWAARLPTTRDELR